MTPGPKESRSSRLRRSMPSCRATTPTRSSAKPRPALAALVLARVRITAAAELPLCPLRAGALAVIELSTSGAAAWRTQRTGKRAIRDWLRVRPETGSAQVLFVQADGTPLSKTGIRSLWRRIARKSGRQDRAAHRSANDHQAGAPGGRRPAQGPVDDGLGQSGHGAARRRRGGAGEAAAEARRVLAHLAINDSTGSRNPLLRARKILGFRGA